jgi:hypothetical protein
MHCQWHRMHNACGVIDTACTCACGINDTACTVHAASMTPHARCMRYQWHRMHDACGVIDTFMGHAMSLTPHARSTNGPGSLWREYLSKTYMFPKCPTPPLNKYINLKGIPNKNFMHVVSLTPHAWFLHSKIDHILANSKQNSKRL